MISNRDRLEALLARAEHPATPVPEATTAVAMARVLVVKYHQDQYHQRVANAAMMVALRELREALGSLHGVAEAVTTAIAKLS